MSPSPPPSLDVLLVDLLSGGQLHLQVAVAVFITIVFARARSVIADLPAGQTKPFTPENFNPYLPVTMTALVSTVGKAATRLKDALKEAPGYDVGSFSVEWAFLPERYGPAFLAGFAGVMIIVSLLSTLWLTGKAAECSVRMVWSAERRAVGYKTPDGTEHPRYPPLQTRYLTAFFLASILNYWIAWMVSYL